MRLIKKGRIIRLLNTKINLSWASQIVSWITSLATGRISLRQRMLVIVLLLSYAAGEL